jgi:DmsE family decaheme c-type cytochrome
VGRKLIISSVFIWLAALVTVQIKAAPSVAPAEKPEVAADLSATPAAQGTPQGVVAPQSSNAKYVGEDTCLTCHENVKAGYDKSKHHIAIDDRTPAAKQSCETCHGPGSEHAEDPTEKHLVNLKTAKADVVNATCTTCHNRGEHALWDTSTHANRGVACTSCHSVHNPVAETAQLKARTQMELCANCHRDKVSKLDRSGHMPVREGKMQCTSCHNVHGSTNVKQLRTGDTVAGLCTSCHVDKRGPYLWEHAPTTEGCTTCHDPHGSQNERMLVAKLPILCQRCHIATRHPSTIYDGAVLATSNRVFGRSCVTCHSAIHGSNHPSGQFFLR